MKYSVIRNKKKKTRLYLDFYHIFKFTRISDVKSINI